MELTVSPQYENFFDETICEGNDYVQNGFNYINPTTGQYDDTLYYTSINGCDSTHILHLTVQPNYYAYYVDAICQGGDYTLHGFSYILPEAGEYTDTIQKTNVNTCDSLLILNLTVFPRYDILLEESICEGDDYVQNGFEYIAPTVGQYLDTLFLTSVMGCDSIMALNLAVYPVSTLHFADTICEGENYLENGFNYILPVAGLYEDTLFFSTVNGCDSLRTINLTVKPRSITLFEEMICEGESYEQHGFSYVLPEVGYYADTITYSMTSGCDSLEILRLSVMPKFETYFADTICKGGSYNHYGFSIQPQAAGIYYDTLYLQSQYGCDSTAMLELTVMDKYHTNIEAIICDGEDYVMNGFSYIQPAVGEYSSNKALHSIFGCDSIVSLHLIVGAEYFMHFNDTICEGESYTEHGFNLDPLEAGEYMESITFATAAAACDSVIEVNLIVKDLLPVVSSEIHGANYVVVATDTHSGIYHYSIEAVEGATGYEWSVSNGNWIIESSGTQCTLYVTTHGYGELTVRIIGECNYEEVSKGISSVFGIEEEDNGINIYPNPTDGELTIEISDYRGEVQVSVIDNSGKLCAILSKLLTKSERKIFLDLESYPAGVYFIVVKKQGTFYTEKVVIR